MDTEDLAKQMLLAFRKMSKNHTKYHAKADTKRSEMSVLNVLAGNANENGLMITEISKILNLPPSAVTPVINTLEEKNLIVRKNSPGDRRIVLVELTGKGHEYYRKRHEFFYRKAVQLCNYLGEKDAKEFVRLFKKASEFMSNYPDNEDCDNNIRPES